MPDPDIDLLVLIVVSLSQSKKLQANLNRQHFYFTTIDSANSLFHEPTVCLLLGLKHERLETLKTLVRKYCQPYRKFIPVEMRSMRELGSLPVMESQEGGATLYALPVEAFDQI
ncbi:MAG: cyclic-di-AMP receptor [Anaerolineaceae bacterium]|nr:cyclic-di-AMP receptor [Anaerolineaceae bacterium]